MPLVGEGSGCRLPSGEESGEQRDESIGVGHGWGSVQAVRVPRGAVAREISMAAAPVHPEGGRSPERSALLPPAGPPGEQENRHLARAADGISQ